jgi:ribosomal protein S18 acetylase RimI-like enzyme
MKDGFRIVSLQDWDRVDELIALFRTGLGETTRAFWHWKYCEPNGLPDSCFWIVEDQKGRMVGTFGIQPYYYRQGNSELMVVQLQDMVVASECRGFGFVRELYHTALEYSKQHGGTAFVAYSNSASIGPFMKYGSINMGDIGSIYSNINEFAFLMRSLQSLQRGDWIFTVKDSMPEDIFFTECWDVYKMVKSSTFMRWRFDLNPEEKFYWLEVRNKGELFAWVVFQENRGRVHTAINIYDYDIRSGLSEKTRRQMVDFLRRRGSYVSLFGRIVPEEKERWMAAGLNKEQPPDAHFLLHFFDGSTPPEKWQILRCDRDF